MKKRKIYMYICGVMLPLLHGNHKNSLLKNGLLQKFTIISSCQGIIFENLTTYSNMHNMKHVISLSQSLIYILTNKNKGSLKSKLLKVLEIYKQNTFKSQIAHYTTTNC